MNRKPTKRDLKPSPARTAKSRGFADSKQSGCFDWFKQLSILALGLLLLVFCLVGLAGVYKFKTDILPNLQMTGAVNAQTRASQYNRYFEKLRKKDWEVVSRGPFVIEGKFLYIWQARNPITGEKKVYRWRFDQVSGNMDALTDDAKELDRELKFTRGNDNEQPRTSEEQSDGPIEENIEVPPETTAADEPVPSGAE